MDSRWFNCSCRDAHHAIRVTYDVEVNEVFFEMRVNNYKNFWQRLVASLKYLFNLDNKDASYDTFLLSEEDRDVMIAVMKKIK